MTKKDFELIAGALKHTREMSIDSFGGTMYEGAVIALDRAAYELAKTLATTNPRFDRARFLAACGVQS